MARSENKVMKRENHARFESSIALPNLVDIQVKSFNDFIDHGVKEVLTDVFPIISGNGKIKLSYISHRFEEPQYPIELCKNHNRTYKKKLLVTLSLDSVTENSDSSIQTIGETEEGLLGEFPWMTKTGTFIFKGVERVIVSQLVRSPGVYYKKEREKTGSFIYGCELIPQRGTYLQFESDAKNVLYVRIDRQKKTIVTNLFKALGITSREKFIELFGNNEYIQATLQKDNFWTEEGNSSAQVIQEALREIYEKMKSGEPFNVEGGNAFIKDKFFVAKKYDLTKAGRFKINGKLNVYNNLLNKIIAEDIFDENGEVIVSEGTRMTKDVLDKIKDARVFENGGNRARLDEINTKIDNHADYISLKVYKDETRSETMHFIGNDPRVSDTVLTIPDIVAAFSYYMNFIDGVGISDDIDHLSNRRVKTVGELIQNQFRIGLARVTKNILNKMSLNNGNASARDGLIQQAQQDSPRKYLQANVLTSAINDFFSTNQLSSFLDQTNPLSELTNKRRLSSLGQGGLTKERAGMDVRDVHYSHYGRICPIETPEGPNIGLINNLCTFARVNEYGFLETPYRPVNKETFEVIDEAVYLSAGDEFDKYITQANVELEERDGKKYIKQEKVIARYRGDPVEINRAEVDYVDVSPQQIIGVAAACIPFLENDDGKRALMGANMQRQAIPLLKPESPYVGTGIEERIAKDSGLAIVSLEDGVVSYVDCKTIKVTNKEGNTTTYELAKFARSNQGTSMNQTPIVKLHDKVTKGQIIADGPAMDHGELALGQNVTVAFMTWDGYNFEDAVIMSDRMVKDDVFTSIHIEEYEVDCRQTKNDDEEITRDLQYASEAQKSRLGPDGIVIPGTKVKEGDILVGKLTPKGVSEPSADEKLLKAMFNEKISDSKDTSLKVPHGGAGTVVATQVLSRENNDELNPGIIKTVKVFVAQKRKISEGDKMAGRHGNKGVISKIVPVEDMPYLADGTPIDIMLNPLGVPTRMNIGQVLELHLGMAAKKLGIKVATPVFNGVTRAELDKMMKEAGIDEDGKTILYDGRTGEPFDERISVGVMYMIKLSHMVDDKIHARATGPYSLVTQQPLGGKAQNGGQRFGEMEVWALQAYGAAHTLQEILTIKSDDIVGRQLTYKSILDGRLIPDAGIPESFKVLQKELQGLGIDCRVLDDENNTIDMRQISKENEEDKYKVSRNLTGASSFNNSYSSFEDQFEDSIDGEVNEEIVYDANESDPIDDLGYEGEE